MSQVLLGVCDQGDTDVLLQAVGGRRRVREYSLQNIYQSRYEGYEKAPPCKAQLLTWGRSHKSAQNNLKFKHLQLCKLYHLRQLQNMQYK